MDTLPTPRRITFLRHATPRVDESASPGSWPLAAEGVIAASALALSPGAVAVSSTDLKARQTTALAMRVDPALIPTDPRFREVDRVEPVSH